MEYYYLPWGLATPNNTTPSFCKTSFESPCFFTLRDECGDPVFFVLSFFLSFVLSPSFVLFSVNFQSPHSIYLFCAPFSERRKEGGPGKKKFERRDKKKALETRTQMERSAACLLKIQWFNKKKRTTTKKFTHRSRGVYYIHFFRDSHAF